MENVAYHTSSMALPALGAGPSSPAVFSQQHDGGSPRKKVA